MNKKILVLSSILMITILAIAMIAIKQKRSAQGQGADKLEFQQRFQSLKAQYDIAKAQGLDVSKAERLGLEAKQAFDAGDYARANSFLDEAALALTDIDIIPSPVQSTDLCAPAPAEDKTQCDQMNAWLDQKLVEWKPAAYKPMAFGAYHAQASDNIFVKSNAEADMKMLDVLLETDADIIVLYIRPGTYFSQKERYDALINKIRSNGKKLFIGARFDDVKMDFNEYDTQLTDYTKDIIAALKPDYYGIILEPTTMESKYNFDVTDEQWAALVDRIAKLSKQLSPATKTVADGHKEELNFLQLASDLASVDIIAFNIYDTNGIYPEYSGYLGTGDLAGNSIDLANSKGKETWMLETWTSAMNTPQQKARGIKEFMEPIDAKWIRLMVYYAQRHNMKAFTPFFTGKFVYYGNDQNGFVSALNNGQRTPVFYEYTTIIEEARNNSRRV